MSTASNLKPKNLDPFTMKLNSISLIEASAGSGKTYNIVNLFVRLVLNVGLDVTMHNSEIESYDNLPLNEISWDHIISSPLNHRLLAKEILVVTYTNAATTEMSSRIIAKLVDLLGKLKTLKSQFDAKASQLNLNSSLYLNSLTPNYSNPTTSNSTLENSPTNNSAGSQPVLDNIITDNYFEMFREIDQVDLESNIQGTTNTTTNSTNLSHQEKNRQELQAYFKYTPKFIQDCLLDIDSDLFDLKVLNQIIAQGRVQACIDILKNEIIDNNFAIKTINSFFKEAVDTYSLLNEQSLYNFVNRKKELITKSLELVIEKCFSKYNQEESIALSKCIPLINLGNAGTLVFANINNFITSSKKEYYKFNNKNLEFLLSNIYTTGNNNAFQRKEINFIDYCDRIFCNFGIDKVAKLAQSYNITKDTTIEEILPLNRQLNGKNHKLNDQDFAYIEKYFNSSEENDHKDIEFLNFYHCCLVFFLYKTFTQYIDLCNQEQVIYFDEYERTLRNLLLNIDEQNPLEQNPEHQNIIVNSIRSQYKFGIIDEFQDTSHLQFDIFNTLFISNHGSSAKMNELGSHASNNQADQTNPTPLNPQKEAYGFIMIGDPKQSIYGFRGADIFSYFEARQKAEYIYTISNNYRSSPDFVNTCNQMFGARYDAFHLPHINYPLAVAGKQNLKGITFEGKTVSPVTFVDLQLMKSLPNADKDNYIARVIQKCIELGKLGKLQLNGKNLQPKDICILEASIKSTNIIAALQKLGINTDSSSNLEIKNDEPSYNALYSLLKAVATLEKANINKYIFSYLSGLNFEQGIKLIRDNEAYSKFLSNFVNYNKIWKEQGLLAMVQTVVIDNKILSRTQTYTNPNLIIELQNIFHLVQFIINNVKYSNQPNKVVYFLDNFDNLNINNDLTEDNNLKESKLEHSNSVHISTIHSSKGLEYGLVFSRYIGGKPNVVTVDMNDYPPTFDRFSNPLSKIESAFLYDCILSEQQRLFYVLLTRPKFGYVGFIEDTKYNKNEVFRDDEVFNDHIFNLNKDTIINHPKALCLNKDNDQSNLTNDFFDYYQDEFPTEYNNYITQLKLGKTLEKDKIMPSIYNCKEGPVGETHTLVRYKYVLSYFLPPHIVLAFSDYRDSKENLLEKLNQYYNQPNIFTYKLNPDRSFTPNLSLKEYGDLIYASLGAGKSHDFTDVDPSSEHYNKLILPVNPQLANVDLFKYINYWINNEEAWQEYVNASTKSNNNQHSTILATHEQSEQQVDNVNIVEQDYTLTQHPNLALANNDQFSTSIARIILPYLVDYKPTFALTKNKVKSLYRNPTFNYQRNSTLTQEVVTVNYLTLANKVFDSYLEQEVSLINQQTDNPNSSHNELNQTYPIRQGYILSYNDKGLDDQDSILSVGKIFNANPSKNFTYLQSFTNLNRVTKTWFEDSVHKNPILDQVGNQNDLELNQLLVKAHSDALTTDTTSTELDSNHIGVEDITSEKTAFNQGLYDITSSTSEDILSSFSSLEDLDLITSNLDLYTDEMDVDRDGTFKLLNGNDINHNYSNNLDLDVNLDITEFTENIGDGLNSELASTTTLEQPTDSSLELDFDNLEKNYLAQLEKQQDKVDGKNHYLNLNTEDSLSNQNTPIKINSTNKLELPTINNETLILNFLPGGTTFGTKMHEYFEIYNPETPTQNEYALQHLFGEFKKETADAISRMLTDALQYPLIDLTNLRATGGLSTRQSLTLNLYQHHFYPNLALDHAKVQLVTNLNSLPNKFAELDLNDFEKACEECNSVQTVQKFLQYNQTIQNLDIEHNHNVLKLANTSSEAERICEWNFVIRPPLDDSRSNYMIDFVKVLVEHKVLFKDFLDKLESKHNQDQLYHLLVNGKFEGAIDLILFTNREIFVIDYKSNNLGNSLENYNQLNLFKYMHKSGYLLQIYIYLAATYAYLSQGIFAHNQKSLEKLKFVGMNLFTRGMLEQNNSYKNTGVYTELPSHKLLQQLAKIIQPHLSFKQDD